MTNEQRVFEFLKKDGECWHEPMRNYASTCRHCHGNFKYGDISNPDLTTDSEWIMARLPEGNLIRIAKQMGGEYLVTLETVKGSKFQAYGPTFGIALYKAVLSMVEGG